ncbi:pyridoxal-phosphate dependent enzyme [Caldivirga sp. UBA161]|uniref:pyridoxal-phosphate dependent enzyme n=1 Tax=Caldivirga sp. UBA161 TaxID=1915569 RepID=UPI0025BE76F8|nr:pyridoxal-phosphate dependent enzyme [Caldivirga sp. UBA161]
MEFTCILCGYRSSEPGVCPRCGLPLLYRASFSKFHRSNLPGVWRYINELPKPSRLISLGEGFTKIRRINGIMIKYEGNNPTGTYYDRGSAVLASVSNSGDVELTFEEDLTRSLALYLSMAGVKVTVSVDSSVDPRDLLILAKLSTKVCVNCVRNPSVDYFNPLLIEGFKTISYELIEQLDNLRAVTVPVERGALALALVKGFMELEDKGIISVMPRIIGVHVGSLKSPIGDQLRELGVNFMSVKPEDTINAVVELAKHSVFARPISASAYVAAKGINESIAIVSGSPKVRAGFSTRAERSSKTQGLQDVILTRVPKGVPLTAYGVWKAIGEGSLLGVYKALDSLTSRGLATVMVKVVGKRKVKYYILGS